MKPELLMICIDFPDENFPEKGIFFKDHAEALSLKFNVTVAVIETPSFRESLKLNSSVIERSHELFKEIRFNLPVLTHRIKSSVEKALEKASREITSYVTPKLIVAQTSLPSGKIARNVAEFFDCPYFIFEHYSFLAQQLEDEKADSLYAYSNANAILAVSESLIDVIEIGSGFSAHLLENCLGSEFKILDQLSPKEDKLKLLWVGRNHPVKQPELLIEIINTLPTDVDWGITIVARNFDEHKKKVEKSLLPRVTFIESSPRESLIELYRQHDITLCTSSTETFGLSLLESIASGTPVITTPCGGPSQFITDYNGVITDDFQESTLVNDILRVRHSLDSYDGKLMSSNIIEKYGAQQFAERFKSVVQECAPEVQF